jgi:hypothetical protein
MINRILTAFLVGVLTGPVIQKYQQEGGNAEAPVKKEKQRSVLCERGDRARGIVPSDWKETPWQPS